MFGGYCTLKGLKTTKQEVYEHLGELPHGVIASDPALDAGECGNPVLLLETWGLDRHVAALLAMTAGVLVSHFIHGLVSLCGIKNWIPAFLLRQEATQDLG